MNKFGSWSIAVSSSYDELSH